MKNEKLKGVDLFTGAGGLTLGFKKAGIVPIASVEKNRDAFETYKKHTPEGEHFCDDIVNVDLSKYRGKTHIVFGGPPCQPFSTGGLRKGRQDARDMLPAFLEVVRLLEPEVVFMENVPGLLVKSRINYLHEILDKISALGFHVSAKLLNAADYGVPQKRRRLFIVGYRDKKFWFPRPTHGPGTKRDYVASGVLISHEPLGEPPNCPVVYAKYPDLRPSPYAGHVYNGGGRPIDLSAPSPTILASAGGYKTPWIDTLGIAVEYHKHLVSGGPPREGAVPGARRLTAEESALLQTFPRKIKFAGSRSSQYTQIGDAVPPRLAEVLGREILKQLNGAKPNASTHYVPEDYQQPLLCPEE
jgi:DNA (cytosine-5)-methyltransferase 1